jgi:hypothetical protein
MVFKLMSIQIYFLITTQPNSPVVDWKSIFSQYNNLHIWKKIQVFGAISS